MGVLANDGIRYPKNTYNSGGYEANQPFLGILAETMSGSCLRLCKQKVVKVPGWANRAQLAAVKSCSDERVKVVTLGWQGILLKCFIHSKELKITSPM